MENGNYHIRVPFSMDAPYLTTGELEDIPSQQISLELSQYDEVYLAPPASDMPTDTAMVKLLRNELATLFHERTAEMIRYERSLFTDNWLSSKELAVGMSAFDETLPTLPRRFFRDRGRPKEYANKQIAIYFQCTSDDKRYQHYLPTGGMIGRYAYRHWLQMHRGRPPFQRHHFLATPIEFIGGQYLSRHYIATDLPYVLAFHNSLCDSVAAWEDDIMPDNESRRWRRDIGQLASDDTTGKKYPRWKRPDFAPCPSEGPLSYRQHGYQLGHLFGPYSW